MKQSLQLKIGQNLAITPQLQQAIKLLQLSILELDVEIRTTIEFNPLLEVEEEFIYTPWEDYYSNISTYASNREPINLEAIHSNRTTLREHLNWQLNLSPFSGSEHLIAGVIIDAISDHGYLTCNLEDIKDSIRTISNIEIREIEEVLHKVQQFDPVGVGSRNLQEYLMIQLDSLPKNTPFLIEAKKLITYHLHLLAKKNYTRLKSRLNLNNESLQSVLQILTKLNPRPDTSVSNEKPEFIVPDIIVMKKLGRWVVELNLNYLPKVRINKNYASMIKHRNTNRENKFLHTQLNEAKWFIRSLHNRNETLLRVATCIVKYQRPFLEYGAEAMQPLNLQDIAKDTGLHESTISRITTKKYMYTPKGLFELKYFFSSQLTTNTGGECSSTAIRALIKKIVMQEQAGKPLSDSKIAKLLLVQQGIKVARRTVAKYRESMAILPSNQRKQVI